jgi:hypothetical protein
MNTNAKRSSMALLKGDAAAGGDFLGESSMHNSVCSLFDRNAKSTAFFSVIFKGKE